MKTILKEKGLWGRQLLLFETLPSTNRWALENISECWHGDIIRAIKQTAGRGRFQRPWISPGNRCLTFSVILKPEIRDEWMLPVFGQIAAVAVRAALAMSALQAYLKWPNDVMVSNRKIAGILAERHLDTGALVLGIGLNVNLTANDLQGLNFLQPAASMSIESRHPCDIERVLENLLHQLENLIDSVQHNGMSALLELWNQHDYLKGKQIGVSTPNGVIYGAYAGLDAEGRIRLIDQSSQTHVYSAGDVTIQRQPGLAE